MRPQNWSHVQNVCLFRSVGTWFSFAFVSIKLHLQKYHSFLLIGMQCLNLYTFLTILIHLIFTFTTKIHARKEQISSHKRQILFHRQNSQSVNFLLIVEAINFHNFARKKRFPFDDIRLWNKKKHPRNYLYPLSDLSPILGYKCFDDEQQQGQKSRIFIVLSWLTESLRSIQSVRRRKGWQKFASQKYNQLHPPSFDCNYLLINKF